MSNKSKKLKLKIKGKDSESREEITMNTEIYILTKLKNLSEEDELLAQEIEKNWVHGQLH